MPDNDNGADEALQDYLTRIEALSATIRVAQDQITDLYLDLKNDGFDVKAVKRMVKAREIQLVRDNLDAADLYNSAAGDQ